MLNISYDQDSPYYVITILWNYRKILCSLKLQPQWKKSIIKELNFWGEGIDRIMDQELKKI